MNSHIDYRLVLALQHHEQERRRADEYRLAASLPRARRFGRIRRSFGRSLIRIGQRLSGEAHPSIQPARSR